MDDLEERLNSIQRDIRALQLEWENTYDKLRHMMGRVAKRAEQLHDQTEDRGALAPGAPGDGDSTNGLTPRQKAMNHQILQRRARLTLGK